MLMLSKAPTFSHFTARFRCDGKEHIRNNKENSYHPENLLFLEAPNQELETKTKQVSHISVQRGVHLALGGLLCWCEETVGLLLEQKHLIWKA